MSIIWRKVWRDLARNKTRTLLVVLSTAVGVMALGIVISLSALMGERMTAEWQATRPAHIVIALGRPVDDQTVVALADTPGVASIEPANRLNARWKRPGETEWRNAQLTARQDYLSQQQDIVTLSGGAWPEKGALAVERHTASVFGLPPGGQVVIETDRGERTLNVAGVVRDLTTFPPEFGGDASFFATPETFRILAGFEGYTRLLVRLPLFDDAAARAVAGALEARLEKIGVPFGTPSIQDPQRHFIQDTLDPLLLIMGALGAVSLALSAFLVVNTVNAVLAQQVSQIGIMKAVGATASRVSRVYLLMVFVYGAIAVVLAVPLAALIANWLAGVLLDLLSIDLPSFQLVPRAVAVQAIVGLLAPVLAAVGPVLAGSRISVHEAIATYGLGGDFGRGPLDRLISRLGGLPRPLALSLRNTFRRKWRMALTQATLTIAGVLFIAVASTGTSFTYTLDRLLAAYGFDVYLVFETPQRFERAETIARSVPGVVDGEVWTVRSGTLEMVDDRRREVVFWALPTDSAIFQPAVTAGRWLQPGDENVIVVNQKIAEEEGLRVGDSINVSLDTGDSTWIIVGLLVDLNNQQNTVFLPRDAFSRALRLAGRGSLFWIKTERHDPAYQARVAQQLRETFEANAIGVSFSLTASENRDLNTNQFAIITTLLLAMSVLAGVVGSLGLAGTMSINVLERSREIGVMRAIGASSRALLGIFVVEGVIVGLLSAIAAAPLSYPAAQLFSDALTALVGPLNFQYSLEGLFTWLGVIVVLSALASLWPALRATRLSVRESLAYE